MEEEKKGGWSTPVSKSGKKGKKKSPQAEVSVVSVGEDWEDLSQYEGNGGKLPIHPVAELDDEILELLNPIFQMTRFLGYHFGRRAVESGRYVAPSENLELMYATIFCFKVIGSCIERAAAELVKQKKTYPTPLETVDQPQKCAYPSLARRNVVKKCFDNIRNNS